jgi:catechol-2,3-dioxygenase
VTTEARTSPAAPIIGLSHVQLVVADLGASAAWYTVVLGLEQQAAGDGYVALRHRPARLVIVLSTSPEPGPTRREEVRGSLDHLAFTVPDGDTLADWADHLRRIGVEHDGVVTENGNPSLQLRDPDGNAIELVAPGHGRH